MVENNAIMLTNSNVSSSATTYRLKIVLPSSFTLMKLVLYNSIIRSIAIATRILVYRFDYNSTKVMKFSYQVKTAT